MIEVGYLEPPAQLQIDAKWWLLNSGGFTRMVLIILADSNPDSLHFDVWEMQPNQRHRTRHSPLNIPMCTSTIDVDSAGVVTPLNTSLTIPYNVIFDNPYANAQDVVFTANDLSQLALHLYAGFRS